MKRICLGMILSCVAIFGPVFAQTEDTIEVKTGEEVVVELESNPTVGYHWELENQPGADLVFVSKSKFGSPIKNMTGAGGKEVWVFKAVSAGNITLRFEYIRPWESNEPAKSKMVYVVIREK